jgi:hypothetical protein
LVTTETAASYAVSARALESASSRSSPSNTPSHGAPPLLLAADLEAETLPARTFDVLIQTHGKTPNANVTGTSLG